MDYFPGINCETVANDAITFESILGRSLINEQAIIKRLREKFDQNLLNRFLFYLI
jgi:hypothetical protein